VITNVIGLPAQINCQSDFQLHTFEMAGGFMKKAAGGAPNCYVHTVMEKAAGDDNVLTEFRKFLQSPCWLYPVIRFLSDAIQSRLDHHVSSASKFLSFRISI